MLLPPVAMSEPHNLYKMKDMPGACNQKPLQRPRPARSHPSSQQDSRQLIVPTSTQQLPNHLHRITRLTLSNSTKLILKQSPSQSIPLLRHDRRALKNESAILCYLAHTSLPIPRLLQNTASSLVTSHLPGCSMSSLKIPPTAAERTRIDRQLSGFRSQLSGLTAPTFGPAFRCASKQGGLPSWSAAFIAMLESTLMDGEDGCVNMPYLNIRTAIASCKASLDELRTARLVVPKLGSKHNVLLERKGGKLEVTGLLGLGEALWGDTAFADVEAEVASQGWEDVDDLWNVRGTSKNEKDRKKCYLLFWAVDIIVRNNYRPNAGPKELDARKALIRVLNGMDGLKTPKEI